MPDALAVKGLSDVQKLVLLSIVSHANADHSNSMFWGQGRIGQELGKGRSTVNRALKVLEEKGLIVRSPNYRKTEDGRSYRSSDTIVAVYNRFEVIPDEDTQDPPSDPTSLPLVAPGQQGSAPTTTGVVLSGQQGSAPAAQLNREPNREPEQGREQGREIGNLVSRSATADRGNEHKTRKAQMLDMVQRIAQGNDEEAENLESLLDLEYGLEAADHFTEKWSIPRRCTSRYEAGKWLNKFINSCVIEGHIERDESEQRNAQLAALAELAEQEKAA